MSREAWSLAPGTPGYPTSLLELDERPQPTLHAVGCREAIEGLDHDATVTIVGSRSASGYGLRVAETLARELASAGVTIVSGLARGIDAAAHRGALAGAGTTVAVLAGGPDVVYPPSHRELYERVADAGAVLSEHRPGVHPRKHFFPARNRIMAALGRAVVIVEAAQPSGSLITAEVALTLGRMVGAVPGPVGTRNAAGTNGLIRDGAALIAGARDVLDLLFGVGNPGVRPEPALDPGLRTVLELVRAGASTIDELCGDGPMTPGRAAAALARLELLGLVASDACGSYAAADTGS